ncbi:MAG: acyl-[acyl-carrier-protein]--UDP-N-acetylglucosamine O-acyltransferase, partial [Planctomycetota bacterium]
AAMLGGYVSVGDRAFISGNAAVHQFVRVGKMAMVSGLGGFSKDIPPFCTAAFRNSIWGLNMVGLRRAGLTPADRQDLRDAFKLLFRSEFDRQSALQKIRQEFSNPYVLELVDFIATSKRGICRYAVREGRTAEEDV